MRSLTTSGKEPGSRRKVSSASTGRWNALTGELLGSPVVGALGDPLAAFAGDHGAEIFRSCIACHTLSAKDEVRAGPTLAGIFGRRIASLPGYNFSEALKKMKTGDSWEIVLPAELGYGADGAGDSIPPNQTLIFTMTLVKVEYAN